MQTACLCLHISDMPYHRQFVFSRLCLRYLFFLTLGLIYLVVSHSCFFTCHKYVELHFTSAHSWKHAGIQKASSSLFLLGSIETFADQEIQKFAHQNAGRKFIFPPTMHQHLSVAEQSLLEIVMVMSFIISQIYFSLSNICIHQKGLIMR